MILLIQEIKNFVLFVSFVVNLLSRILSQSRTHRVPFSTYCAVSNLQRYAMRTLRCSCVTSIIKHSVRQQVQNK